MKKEKIILLGSSGFVGQALVEEYHNQDNLLIKDYNSTSLNLLAPTAVENISQELSEDITLVISLRSHAEDQLQSFYNYLTMITNIGKSLLKRRVKKCIYLSTLSVYDNQITNLALNEEASISPPNLYGISKWTAESLLKNVLNESKIPYTILRICKVYGPRDFSDPYGPSRFIQEILNRGRVYLYGDGSELRDQLFVGDLTRIVNEFTTSDAKGIYNVGSGKSHSYQEVIESIREISRLNFIVETRPRTGKKVDQKLDVAKLRSVLPGFQFTSLKDGLKQTFHFFKNLQKKGVIHV